MTKWRPTVAALAVVIVMAASACSSGRSSSGEAQPSPTTGASSSVPQFGDLESPCGPGSPTGNPDQGVGADTVSIGFGDDSGFQGSPGLGHEAGDAVEAMVEWCNEQGGINGRTVVGTRYDAKVTELATAVTDACAKDFMLVGAFFALPESAEPIRLGCGLPTVPGLISGPRSPWRH